MVIQAVLLDKNKFTLVQAKKYIHDHKYKPIKAPHITDQFIRFRLVTPNYKKFIYRIMDLSDGVKAILQIPK
jgi:hypothetical protein